MKILARDKRGNFRQTIKEEGRRRNFHDRRKASSYLIGRRCEKQISISAINFYVLAAHYNELFAHLWKKAMFVVRGEV